MWPTMFMTGVNWQLGEMMTASHMTVVVSGNGGTRQLALSIFSDAILQAMGPLFILYKLPQRRSRAVCAA